MHVFCIFVFAPVQRNLACFTWEGAQEIRSLSLSSSFLLFSLDISRDIHSKAYVSLVFGL